MFFFSLHYIKKLPLIHVSNGLALSFSISIIQIISFQDNHGQKQHLSSERRPHPGQRDCWSTQESTADLICLLFFGKQWDGSDRSSRSSLFFSATSFVLFSLSSRECERKYDKVHFQWVGLTGKLEILTQQRYLIKKKERKKEKITLMPSVMPAEESCRSTLITCHPHHRQTDCDDVL